jgi:hypothetical protein
MSPTQIKTGSRIETTDDECGKGTIEAIEKNGTIHVLYDDGTRAVYSLFYLLQLKKAQYDYSN